MIGAALLPKDGGVGNVGVILNKRITGGDFIDVCGAVTNPLSCDENRHFDMHFDLAHFERGRMAGAEQEKQKSTVALRGGCSGGVGNACGLHNGTVVSHVVNDANKSLIQDGEFLA